MNAKHIFTALAITPLFLLGCSDDSTTSGDAGGAFASPEAVEVTPEAGGTLDDDENGVSLVVPEGAVAAAVSVSLSVTAKTADTVSEVFRLSPEDTIFEVPATLTIELTGVSVPVGMALAIAQEIDGEWSVLVGSEGQSGGVVSPLTKLGSFAAVLVDAGPASLCDESCMSQPDAECCTGCGCGGSGSCTPVCGEPFVWDCELACCFDYDALVCEF